MRVLLPALLLLVATPVFADPVTTSELRSGADIQAFRAIGEAGLSDADRFEAYGAFVASYPRSPLAEVALAHCLELGGDMSAVLAQLAPAEKSFLVNSFQAHAETLLANPAEGPMVTDAAQARPRRGTR